VHRPHPAEAEIADELAEIRPDLLSRYANRLPGARAAVLTRLWRALAHEPLPWITGRERIRDGLTLRLRDGRRLHGPAADPYATDAYVTVVHLDGTAYDHPARLMTALAVPHGDDFAAELAHSVASLALSRAGAEPLSEEWPLSDWEWEQRVVDGHPYHPNCRSRPGFSAAEQLAYGPEHRPIVQLGTVPVRASDCLVTGEWPDELRDGGQLLLPVHPWQTAHVLNRGGGGGGAGTSGGGGGGAARTSLPGNGRAVRTSPAGSTRVPRTSVTGSRRVVRTSPAGNGPAARTPQTGSARVARTSVTGSGRAAPTSVTGSGRVVRTSLPGNARAARTTLPGGTRVALKTLTGSTRSTHTSPRGNARAPRTPPPGSARAPRASVTEVSRRTP
jgi:hypothetical protein